MNRTARGMKVIPLAIGTCAMGLTAQIGLSQEEGEEPFEVAQLYFELNHTDGDLGIHGLIDGDAWKQLDIAGPNDLHLLDVWVRNNLRKQGMTEFFFESAEPPFDELSPAAFFKRFPEGLYEYSGVTLEGVELESQVRLSHVLAGPPGSIKVNGKNGASSCDANLPVVSAPVIIDWAPVTKSHPNIGTPNVPVQVMQYQFICEIEREGKVPDELAFVVDLPASRTQFTCPAEFTALSDGEVKYEIIAKLKNGNQTAIESCFELQ